MRRDLVITYAALAVFAIIWSTITLHLFEPQSFGYWVMLLGGGALFGITVDRWPGFKKK